MAVQKNTEDDMIRRAISGDRNAEEQVVSQYARLVRACARPYFLAGGDSEDLIQEGMLGLLSAIRDYEPAKEVSFSTYAELCIKRRLYSAIKSASSDKHTPLNRSLSFEAPYFDESNPQSEHLIKSFDRRDTEEQVLGREYANELYSDLLERLSQFEARILGLYLEGLSYREIAEEIKKTPKSVDNAVQRIRRKLSRRL